MSVSNISLKLDAPLQAAFRSYSEHGASDASGIGVTLQFSGPLAAIEDLGFETHSVFGNEAMGIVLFADLEKLADHAGVEWIAVGRADTVELNTAAKDVNARAPTAAAASTLQGRWFVPVPGDAVSGGATATGKGVIIAVLDTGIDYQHPMFMKALTPLKETRIIRIWDMGLPPATAADGPDPALLGSNITYGTEFDHNEIDAALNAPAPLGHRDCVGHGTHVAGIAAGGPLGDAEFVGIAPEADILVVKRSDVGNVRFGVAGSLGAEVGADVRFRDAVLYSLRVARDLGRPVVINMSFSRYSAPGDGLDARSRFVDGLLEPTASADADHFPKGAIVVKTSGNKGDSSSAPAARIEMPPSGEIVVPFELTDTRRGLQTRFLLCQNRRFSPSIDIDIWYRRTVPFTATRIALKLPLQSGFSGDMGVGGHLAHGFRYRVAPRRIEIVGAPRANLHSVRATHEGNPAVPHPDGGTVRRHHIGISLEARIRSGTVSYAVGTYELRMRAPAGTEFFVMCDQIGWARGKKVGFRIADTMADGSARHANIHVQSEHSMADPMGRYAVTVGAYDDTNGNPAAVNHHGIADFSSRGPMRDYAAAPQLPIDVKPDIAAPGVDIESADSLHTMPGPNIIRTPAWLAGDRFIPHGGTSMAAPMVAGAVALMLEKNGTLDSTEVKALINTTARHGTSPAHPGVGHDRAYGGGMLDAAKAHDQTP